MFELGGRVLECPQGFRAECAQVAAILLIDEVLTKPISPDQLRYIAKSYGVPALVPHSMVGQEYREAIDNASSIVNDLDAELAQLLGN